MIKTTGLWAVLAWSAIASSTFADTPDESRHGDAWWHQMFSMEVFAPDMIHYDDWDLRSPTALNARADIHLAAFRKFVRKRLSDDDCRATGIDKANPAAFDLWKYLGNPPWRTISRRAANITA